MPAVRIVKRRSLGRGPSWADLTEVWVAGASASSQATAVSVYEDLLSPLPNWTRYDIVQEAIGLSLRYPSVEGGKYFSKWIDEGNSTRLDKTARLGKHGFFAVSDPKWGALAFVESLQGKVTVVVPINTDMYFAKSCEQEWSQEGLAAIGYDKPNFSPFNGCGRLCFADDRPSDISMKIDCPETDWDHLQKLMMLLEHLRASVFLTGALSLEVTQDPASSETIFNLGLRLGERHTSHKLPGPGQCVTSEDWDRAWFDLEDSLLRALALEHNRIDLPGALDPFADTTIWPTHTRFFFRKHWKEIVTNVCLSDATTEEWETITSLFDPYAPLPLRPIGFKGGFRPGDFSLFYVKYLPDKQTYQSGSFTRLYPGVFYDQIRESSSSLGELITKPLNAQIRGKLGRFCGKSYRSIRLNGSLQNSPDHIEDLLDFLAFVCAELNPFQQIFVNIDGAKNDRLDSAVSTYEVDMRHGPVTEEFWTQKIQEILGPLGLGQKKRWLDWRNSSDRMGALKKHSREVLDPIDSVENGDTEQTETTSQA